LRVLTSNIEDETEFSLVCVWGVCGPVEELKRASEGNATAFGSSVNIHCSSERKEV